MAMTLQQAQQLVESSGGRMYDGGGTATATPVPAGNGDQPPQDGPNGSVPEDVLLRYITGQATADDLSQLLAAGMITANEAQNYYGSQQKPDTTKDPRAGLYPYDPRTGYIGKYPADSQVGDSHFTGPVTTYIDPSTGIIYDANGKALPQYMQRSLGGVGGSTGGGGGSAGANQQAQLAYDYAQLAQNQRQFEKNFGLNEQQFGQQVAANRNQSGLTLGDFVRSLSNDAYNRAADPGNFPAYLAAMSGLPQGSGSPISSLLGQGIEIQSPTGSNPMADPRFQQLISNLYGYANQPSSQAPPTYAPPAYASGGTQMLNEPVIGIGLHSGQPKFLAGEAGQEKLTFEPVHNHSNGGMPVPHSHAMGDQQHEHNADGSMAQDMRKYADGGSAIAEGSGVYGGDNATQFTPHQLISAYNAYHPNAQMADTTYTPAEGSAISLGKALQPLGYAPRALLDELLAGRAPLPGALNEQFMQRLPTSLRLLLGATVKSFVGNSGLQDFNDAMQQYAMPGQSGYTQNAYL